MMRLPLWVYPSAAGAGFLLARTLRGDGAPPPSPTVEAAPAEPDPLAGGGDIGGQFAWSGGGNLGGWTGSDAWLPYPGESPPLGSPGAPGPDPLGGGDGVSDDPLGGGDAAAPVPESAPSSSGSVIGFTPPAGVTSYDDAIRLAKSSGGTLAQQGAAFDQIIRSNANIQWGELVRRLLGGEAPATAYPAVTGLQPGPPELRLSATQYLAQLLGIFAGSPRDNPSSPYFRDFLPPPSARQEAGTEQDRAYLAYLLRVGPAGYVGVNSGVRDDREYWNIVNGLRGKFGVPQITPDTLVFGSPGPPPSTSPPPAPTAARPLTLAQYDARYRQGVIDRARATGHTPNTDDVNATIRRNYAAYLASFGG